MIGPKISQRSTILRRSRIPTKLSLRFASLHHNLECPYYLSDTVYTILAILDKPNIDCVLVPLPNALHFEWAVRAIRAGPARSLSLSFPNPIWSLFRSLVNPADVVHVDTFSMIPWWMVTKDHIHFNYSLAGGTMMEMGTYDFAALRMIFDAEPEDCLSCDVKAFTQGIHQTVTTSLRPNSGFPTAEPARPLARCRVLLYDTPLTRQLHISKSWSLTRRCSPPRKSW